jgi:hypothetical protein
MKVTYKKILIVQNLNESVQKLGYAAEDYIVLGKLTKLVKKLAGHIEAFQELVEDAKLDHCMKDGLKIIRENGQLQWTAQGEKDFRKAYKEILETEVEVDATPIQYTELVALVPSKNDIGEWEDVKNSLSPFFE